MLTADCDCVKVVTSAITQLAQIACSPFHAKGRRSHSLIQVFNAPITDAITGLRTQSERRASLLYLPLTHVCIPSLADMYTHAYVSTAPSVILLITSLHLGSDSVNDDEEAVRGLSAHAKLRMN